MNTNPHAADFADWLQSASGTTLSIRKAALQAALVSLHRGRVSQCSPDEVVELRKALGIPNNLTEAKPEPTVTPPIMAASYGNAPFVGLAQPGTEYDLTVEVTRDHPILIEIAGRSVKAVVKP